MISLKTLTNLSGGRFIALAFAMNFLYKFILDESYCDITFFSLVKITLATSSSEETGLNLAFSLRSFS